MGSRNSRQGEARFWHNVRHGCAEDTVCQKCAADFWYNVRHERYKKIDLALFGFDWMWLDGRFVDAGCGINCFHSRAVAHV